MLKTDFWKNKNNTFRPLKKSAYKKMKNLLLVWASIQIFLQASQLQDKMWLRASIQVNGIICTRIPTASLSCISKTPLRMKLPWANSQRSTPSTQIQERAPSRIDHHPWEEDWEEAPIEKVFSNSNNDSAAIQMACYEWVYLSFKPKHLIETTNPLI